MSQLWSLSVLALVFAIVASHSHEKVSVTVYYESLCADSIRFVTEQLYPRYKSSLRDHFSLKLVPYGKSKVVSGSDEKTWEFECHHGPNECYGNKVHACALKNVPDQAKSLDFIVCLMKKTNELGKNVAYPVGECAAATGVNAAEVADHCANATAGNAALKEMGDATDAFMNPLTSVPTVVVNGKQDKMAVKNFADAVCKHMDHPMPECAAANGAAGNVALVASLSLPLLVAGNFL